MEHAPQAESAPCALASALTDVWRLPVPGPQDFACDPAVRKRFDEAHKARVAAGHKLADNCGMWVSLAPLNSDAATAAGSGIADDYSPKANYFTEDLLTAEDEQVDVSSSGDAQTSAAATAPDGSAQIALSKAFATIDEVMGAPAHRRTGRRRARRRQARSIDPVLTPRSRFAEARRGRKCS
jgi:hypothetical protein